MNLSLTDISSFQCSCSTCTCSMINDDFWMKKERFCPTQMTTIVYKRTLLFIQIIYELFFDSLCQLFLCAKQEFSKYLYWRSLNSIGCQTNDFVELSNDRTFASRTKRKRIKSRKKMVDQQKMTLTFAESLHSLSSLYEDKLSLSHYLSQFSKLRARTITKNV